MSSRLPYLDTLKVLLVVGVIAAPRPLDDEAQEDAGKRLLTAFAGDPRVTLGGNPIAEHGVSTTIGPAVMELLGRGAWWLPAVLDRLYRRLGLSEDDAAGIRLDTKPSVGG
jgi:hypothetical protein